MDQPPISATDLSSQWMWAIGQSPRELAEFHRIAEMYRPTAGQDLSYCVGIYLWWLNHTGQPLPDGYIGTGQLPPDPYWCPVLLGSPDDVDDGRLAFVEFEVRDSFPGSPRGDAATLHHLLGQFFSREGWTHKHFVIHDICADTTPPEGCSHSLSSLIATIAKLAGLPIGADIVATGSWDMEQGEFAHVGSRETLVSKLNVASAWGYKRLFVVEGQVIPENCPLTVRQVPKQLPKAVRFLLNEVWGLDGERRYQQARASSCAGVNDVFVAESQFTDRFVGREKDEAIIRAWVADANDPPVLWLHGPVGIGKTVLAYRALTCSTDHTRTVRFRWSARDRQPWLGILLEKLPRSLGAALGATEEYANLSLAQLIARLQDEGKLKRGQLRVLLDNCDQAHGREQQELFAALRPLFEIGAKVLITSHHPPLDNDAVRPYRLHPLSRNEVCEYVLRAMNRRAVTQSAKGIETQVVQRQAIEPLIDEVNGRSSGVPRFLELLEPFFHEGPAGIQRLPADLDDVAREALKQALEENRDYECLLLLCCAQEPIAVGQLVSLVQQWRGKSEAVARREVETQLSSLGSIVRQRWIDGQVRYELAQEVYRELIESDRSWENPLRQAKGDAFGDWCANWRVHGDLYAINHLATHLYVAERYDDLFKLAVDDEFISRRRRELSRSPKVALQPLELAIQVAIERRDISLLVSLTCHRATALSRWGDQLDPFEVLAEDGLEEAAAVVDELFEHNVAARKLWALLLVLHPAAGKNANAAAGVLLRAFRHRDARGRLVGGYAHCAIILMPLVFQRLALRPEEREKLSQYFVFSIPHDLQPRLAVAMARVGAFGLAQGVIANMDMPGRDMQRDHADMALDTRLDAMKMIAKYLATAGRIGMAIDQVKQIRNGFPDFDTTAKWAWSLVDSIIEPCVTVLGNIDTAERSTEILSQHETRGEEDGDSKRISAQLLTAEALLLLGRREQLQADHLMLRFDALFARFHETVNRPQGGWIPRINPNRQPSLRARLALIAAQAGLKQLARWQFDVAWECALNLPRQVRLNQLNWVTFSLRGASRLDLSFNERLPAMLRQVERAIRQVADDDARRNPSSHVAVVAPVYLSEAVGQLARNWAHAGDFSRATYVLFGLLPGIDRAGHEHSDALAEIAATMFDQGHDYRRLLRKKDARALFVIPRVASRLLEKGELIEALELLASHAASVRRPNVYIWASDLRRLIVALRYRCRSAADIGGPPRFLGTPSVRDFRKTPSPWMFLNLADTQAVAGLAEWSSNSCKTALSLTHPRDVSDDDIPGIARELHRLGQQSFADECFKIAEYRLTALSSHTEFKTKLSLIAELVECYAAVGRPENAQQCLKYFREVAAITGINQPVVRRAICGNLHRLARAGMHEPLLLDEVSCLIAHVVARLNGDRPPGVQHAEAIVLAAKGSVDDARKRATSIKISSVRKAALGDVSQAMLNTNAMDAALQLACSLHDGKRLKQFITCLSRHPRLPVETKIAGLLSMAVTASEFVDATVRLGIELLKLVKPDANMLTIIENTIADVLARTTGSGLGSRQEAEIDEQDASDEEEAPVADGTPADTPDVERDANNS